MGLNIVERKAELQLRTGTMIPGRVYVVAESAAGNYVGALVMRLLPTSGNRVVVLGGETFLHAGDSWANDPNLLVEELPIGTTFVATE
jgi:hypothetical protein